MPLALPAILTGLSVPVFLTIVYLYFFLQNRERYLGFWAASWLVYFLFAPLTIWWYFSEKPGGFIPIDFCASFLSVYLLLRGTFIFLDKKISELWTIAFVAVAIWIIASSLLSHSFFVRVFPCFTFFGIVHIWAGSVVLRSGKVQGLGKYFTGWVFILWGIHKIDYPFLRNIPAFAPWGYLIGGYCAMMLATGLLLIYFQRTQDALAESERKYRSLITNIPDIAWRSDCQGNISYISPKVYDITGFTSEEICHKGVEFLSEKVHPDDIRYVRESWQSLFNGVGAYNIEYRIKKKDGRWVWLQDKATVAAHKDGGSYADGLISEITVRKKAEKERETLIRRLNQVLSQVKTLRGLLPICASCNRIKNGKGSWERIEVYIHNRTDAKFSHSICPECARKLYPEIYGDQ